jgi:hypothetical protein
MIIPLIFAAVGTLVSRENSIKEHVNDVAMKN